MSTPSVASLFFFCLQVQFLILLPARHAIAASSHASYNLGSRQNYFNATPGRSSGNSKQATTNTLCASLADNNNPLPVVHRQSPWSPSLLAASHVLRRDASRIRRRISSQSSSVATAPSLAATTIPANSSSDSMGGPGEMDYSVLISYGTPEQQFPVLLDTSSVGVSMLRCKPCVSGSDDCDPAFDTSRSSTFAAVLCGSPDCPANCSSGSVCTFDDNNIYFSNIVGTYVEDVLTLAPSMAVHDFRFVCLDVDEPSDDFSEVSGTIDLSRDPNSLPSRLGGAATTFSYCLPNHPSSHGFLSLGGDATLPKDDLNLTAQAPLVTSADPELSNMYFIDLVGISLAGEDVPFPAGTFGGKAGATLDIGTTFTMLAPDAYAALRDAFKKEMSQYRNLWVPEFAGFDTCFNFTGVHGLSVPILRIKFSNGEELAIEDQLLYHEDPAGGGFGMTCLAFSSLDDGGDVFSAVIGTYTLGSMEVVYDVAGGKVGFNPLCC